jgi:two-component system sensor histidine kinase AlgZ
MHPLLRDPRRMALYLSAWAILGLLLTGAVSLSRGLEFSRAAIVLMPPTLAYSLVCLSAWWVCRRAPLDRTPPFKLVTGFVGNSLQASAWLAGLGAPWLVWMNSLRVMEGSRSEMLFSLGVAFLIGIPVYAVSMAAHYLVLAFEGAREAERRVLESQVSTREAELRALRAQLNPHFLFNSLNSINALVGNNPEGARRMCESLGDFLRRTLALGGRDAVTLEEELSLVERYFVIERVRFGERLAVESSVEPGAEGCLVPPLLLQPLVENAVKHGIAERLEGGTIRIVATVKDDLLRLSVENDVDEDAKARPGEGVGLQNVKRRLDVLSAREGRLDTWRENGKFGVTLTLPARRGSEPADGGTNA